MALQKDAEVQSLED